MSSVLASQCGEAPVAILDPPLATPPGARAQQHPSHLWWRIVLLVLVVGGGIVGTGVFDVRQHSAKGTPSEARSASVDEGSHKHVRGASMHITAAEGHGGASALPRFVFEGAAGPMRYMDPAYGGIGLDRNCKFAMPADGACLTADCTVWLYRGATTAACRWDADTPLKDRPVLCPCRWQRPSVVDNVVVQSNVDADGMLLLLIAFKSLNRSRYLVDGNHGGTASRSAALSRHASRLDAATSWALVDGCSSEFKSLPCHYGVKPIKQLVHDIASMIEHTVDLGAKAKDDNTTSVTLPRRDALGPPSSTPSHRTLVASTDPHTCVGMARSPHAATAAIEGGVYYALDAAATSPGHSIDMLVLGVAQYFSAGLYERRVPWLVPCSNAWSYASRSKRAQGLIWTTFFLELNNVLQFPVVPLNIALGAPAVTFGRVWFSSFLLGWNQACFRPATFTILWPHAVRLSASEGWDNRLREAQMAPAAGATVRKAAGDEPMPPLQWGEDAVAQPPPKRASGKRISFIKVLRADHMMINGTTSMGSPTRAFVFSVRFHLLLQAHDIVTLRPTIPLFERMWHINTAELIVTTWGSTLATTAALLLPRAEIATTNHSLSSANRSSTSADSSDAVPPSPPLAMVTLRVLVLIHPGYCLEASRLLGVRKRHCSQTTGRGPSRTFRNQVSYRQGATFDFVGGSGFCIKYVVIATLRAVRDDDFEFQC